MVFGPSSDLKRVDERVRRAQRDARLRAGMLRDGTRFLLDLFRTRIPSRRYRRSARAGLVILGQRSAAFAQHDVGEARAVAVGELDGFDESDIELQEHGIGVRQSSDSRRRFSAGRSRVKSTDRRATAR